MDGSELARQLAALRPKRTLVCSDPECGKQFETVTPNRSRWCSRRCRNRAAQRAFQMKRRARELA